MPNKIPNLQLRAWRDSANMTRANMADALNQTPTAVRDGLTCDEKRISKWESGEVMWPRPEYRRALLDLTGRDAESLGFNPPTRRPKRSALPENTASIADALRAEARMFDTLELARLAEMSDIGAGTIEALHQAAELLCRAYPTTPAATLRDRTKRRLHQVVGLLGRRSSLDQHRELLVIAGWMAALLGCVHYDLGEREEAEAARHAAYQWAKQAGHGELMGWAFEVSAWFALVEDNYEQVVEFAGAGRQLAGVSSAGVQLALQEARGWSRLGDRRQTDQALTRGASLLAQLPVPEHRENHFVFDHTKYMFYAATCYTSLGDDARAEEHALEVIAQHVRPDGTTNAPMRTAMVRIDLGIVAARRGDFDQAVAYGDSAFEFERKSMSSFVSRTADLDRLLTARYPGERRAREFHERHVDARRLLHGRTLGSQ
jgi:transcriptional regulator with XRE-family HTH domain